MSMDYTALSFRIASANDSRNSGITEQRFDVIATDAEGRMAAISNADLIRVPHLYYSRRPLELLQTVRMPLSRLMQANPEFDPATISSLSVRFSGGADEGAAFISDVELASDD